MSKAKKEKEVIAIEDMTPNERMKYEIATELGLLDKVKESGWKSLSAKETGKIGGIMTKKKKLMRMEDPNKKL
ncbi:MAG: small, acid-soluble spore protein, alpha/beta type [Anaerocolumna sp.]